MQNLDINYDIDLLRRDKIQRSHIVLMLEELKQKYGIANCSVLELGCGLGQNLIVFREDNRVQGIEGLQDVVREARASGLNITHQNLDFEEVDLPDSSQDCILCLDVLEHLIDPFKLLLEIRRLLSQEGIAFLNVPNHLDIRGRLKILLGSGLDVHNFFPNCNDWDNPHIHFFTYSGFKKMLVTADFRVIEDYSYKASTIPMSGRLSKNIYLSKIFETITSVSPSLFAAGFAMIIKKTNS